ncbi:MAG TPA: ABC transporter permease [Clostridiaceae bacterium]|nr:ABC transporter permease [Clostridiaceae bacterium]
MRRFAFRYILKQKKTTFSIIVGIILTVIMMFSLMQMGDSIAVRYESLLVKGQQFDFSMRHMSAQKQADYARLLENGEADIEDVLILNESLSSTLPENGMDISIIGSEGDVSAVFGFELAEGAFPSQPYEICVEERINTYAETTYKIGDRISLPIRCSSESEYTEETFVISGFIKDLPTGSTYLIGNTTLGTAEEISNKQGYDNDDARAIFVTVEKNEFDSERIYDIMSNLGYGNPLGDLSLKFEINDAKVQAYDEAIGDSFMDKGLKVLTIALSVAAVFLIYNSINLSVAEKIRQYGTLRCLGMKRSQLQRLVLSEVLIYAVLGIGIGQAAGILLNMVVAQSIMSMVIGSEVLLAQRPVTYISVLLLATAVIGVSTYLSIRKLQKLTPLQAMKYTEAENYKSRSFSRENREVKASKRNQFILHLAGRNLSRNRSKTAVTFISIFISALLCMVILNFFLCIDPGENVGMNQKIAKFQLYRTNELQDVYIGEALLEDIRGLEGVNNVYGIGSNSFSYSHTLNIEGFYFSDYLLVVLDDALIQKISPTFLLNPEEEIALIYMYDDGDDFSDLSDAIARVSDGENKDVEFNLKRIEEVPYHLLSGYSGEGVLFVNDKLADRVFGEYEYIDVLIDSDLDYEDLFSQILKMNGMTDQLQLADIEAGSEDAIKELTGILLIAVFVIVFTATLAVLNISNTVRSNIQLRQSENGMLRAIGMTNKTLTAIICTENALVGFMASVLASFFGILISAVIFPQIDSKFHPIIPIFPLVIAVVMLTCIMTAYFPMRAHWNTTIRTHIDE